MDPAMLAAIAAAQKDGGGGSTGFQTFGSFDAKKSMDIAHGKRKRPGSSPEAGQSDSESDLSDDSETAGAEGSESTAAAIDWSMSPQELKAPDEFDRPNAFVAH